MAKTPVVTEAMRTLPNEAHRRVDEDGSDVLAELLNAADGYPEYPMPAYEAGDPTPIAPPVGFVPEVNMFDHMRQVQLGQLAWYQHRQGDPVETVEDMDDFDIAEDPIDPATPWELDREPTMAEIIRLGQEADRQRMEAAAKGLPAPPLSAAFDAIYRPQPAPEPAADTPRKSPSAPSGAPPADTPGGGGSAGPA